ncbi:hypothetical protein AB0Q95_34915 [Streptomyces sp. NPDC059900]|uniref:hypothetical protein n=1 Tax=Streptomyces sp. NPDC059900 TaxID=3155816 RepID=UPI003411FF93
MHARPDTPAGYTLMARDHPAGPATGPMGPATMSRSSTATARGCATMSSGCPPVAQSPLPLERQMRGDQAGSLVDRFGISWMLNITAR